jgi:hypothetical protein
MDCWLPTCCQSQIPIAEASSFMGFASESSTHSTSFYLWTPKKSPGISPKQSSSVLCTLVRICLVWAPVAGRLEAHSLEICGFWRG